ncbi:MAG: hypothetical protein GXY70_01700 [Euryarchaeota archaeon]|nr:hypothetical protein [Euryarchaeota archaeon]
MVKVLKPKGEVKKVEAKKDAKARPAGKAPVKKAEQFDQREESLRTLSQFYMGEMDLKMRMKQMTISTGKEPPEWMAALEILKDNIIKTEHPDLKLKMYQGIVDLLAKVGQKEDLFTIQQIIARYNLKSFKDLGFEKVEIECAEDACPACREMAGKRFRIEEAMETMPIPCRDCTTEVDAVKGYCRCRYFAVF